MNLENHINNLFHAAGFLRGANETALSEQVRAAAEAFRAETRRFHAMTPGGKVIPPVAVSNLRKAMTPKPGPFTGKRVAFTGVLVSLTQQEAGGHVIDHGGTVTGAVSKRTDFLVAGVQAAGPMLEKAKALGTIRILNEADFLSMLSRP